jgi:hypothetical protein
MMLIETTEYNCARIGNGHPLREDAKTDNENKYQNEKECADSWAARHEASLKHRPSGRGRNSLLLLHGRILA